MCMIYIGKSSKKGKTNIARNMLKENIDIDLISKVTGLPTDQINDLKK